MDQTFKADMFCLLYFLSSYEFDTIKRFLQQEIVPSNFSIVGDKYILRFAVKDQNITQSHYVLVIISYVVQQ